MSGRHHTHRIFTDQLHDTPDHELLRLWADGHREGLETVRTYVAFASANAMIPARMRRLARSLARGPQPGAHRRATAA